MAYKKNKGLGIKVIAFVVLVLAIAVSYVAVQNTVFNRSQAKGLVPIPTPLPRYPTLIIATRTPRPTPIPTPTYYLKTTDWITASPNMASTVIHGCDVGDMAIGGGMDGYGGPINVWRTVRSGPSNSTDMNGWQTTVINEDSTSHQFTLTTKCLKLTK